MAKPHHSSLGFALRWQVFAPQALLASLQQHYAAFTSEQLAQALEAGQLSLNGQIITAPTNVTPTDQLQLWLPEHFEAPVHTDWQTLWQNDELLLVNKPAELPVSRTTRNLFNTLVALVRRQTPYLDAHLLHRLDAETSGLILLAKHSQADKFWKPKLAQLIGQKIYHALVWGNPTWDELNSEHYLVEQPSGAIRSQMHVVASVTTGAKLARSRFKVKQRFGAYSLVECELFSGRRHQLRAQLSHLGHAIIGDKIYSQDGHYYLKRLEQELTETELAELGAPHHLLHAQSITLNLPDGPYRFTAADYPNSWQPYLARAKD